VTSVLSMPPINDNWLNAVKPLGWVALSAQGLAIVAFVIFGSWAKSATKKQATPTPEQASVMRQPEEN
jgi:hypothetical protein